MACPTDDAFCLTPVSADGHSPTLSPLPLWKRATVRLESCLPAITAVLQSIFAHRVSEGDAFTSEAALVRCNNAYDLAHAAVLSPTPHVSIAGFERAFFEAQFSAALSPREGPSKPFACHLLPDISVRAYVSRLFTMSDTVSNAAYLLTVMLLNRARIQHPGLFLRSSNVHRLLLAAFVVAAKSHNEDFISNAELAQVGGVSLRELNSLEAAFLALIGWRTQFSKEEFATFEKSVIAEALGTPQSVYVFQALHARNVAGLDEAVRSTRTWALPPSERLLPVEGADALYLGARSSANATRLRYLRGPAGAAGAIAGIAAAISRFSFPEVPRHAAGEFPQLQKRVRVTAYAQKIYEHARLASLLSIVDGTSTETTVPGMAPILVGGCPTVLLSANARAFAGIGTRVWGGEYCTAKESVSYLLNDTDRFEELFRAPPGFDGRCEPMTDERLPSWGFPLASAREAILDVERDCGLEGLL